MEKTKTLSVAEAANIVRDGKNEKAKMNALAGATIEIIGTKFVVELVKKAEGGYTLLLIPTKVDEEPAGRTLQEMINAVKGFFGKDPNINTDDLNTLVKEGGQTKFDDVKICLSMAFLYINKDKDKEKEVEYAFQIKALNLDKLIPDGIKQFVVIKDVQLAIWNTTRKKIIEKMELIKPEDYLKEE